jgi:colanic acid/amylovoran biosynthesis protein
MNIEIHGTSFINKGAELMLCAIAERLRAMYPDVCLAVSPRIGSYGERAKYGLYQKVEKERAGVRGKVLHTVMHAGYRKRYGLLTTGEIDAVLDASGFAYGAPFGSEPTLEMAEHAKRWRRNGTKLILMPQAYGPFNTRKMATAFREIVQQAELVFVRDRCSFEYLQNIGAVYGHVKRAPDFTNLVVGRIPQGFSRAEHRVAVIPNYQIIKHNEKSVGEQYLAFLGATIRHLHAEGMSTCVLVHETQKDEQIVQRLQESAGQALSVVREQDPVRLKGILGLCHAVVASRYHALVSALSQGVPCIGVGWSHKYRELFRDYGCLECLIEEIAFNEDVKARIECVLKDPVRGQLVRDLKSKADDHREKTVKMWSQIATVLRGSG